MKRLAAVLNVALVLAAENAISQVYIEGTSDCADWVKARKTNRAVVLEAFVVGMLGGLSMGRNKEFWHANNVPVSREGVYLWMDNYCQSHPLDVLTQGINQLFRERSGWQSPKAQKAR